MTFEETYVGPDVAPRAAKGGLNNAIYPNTAGPSNPDGWELTEWVVGFEETPLYERFENHVSQGMEFMVLVSDAGAMRGTGKTTLSIQLARAFDTTDDGLTPSKATNSPEEFIDAYVDHAQGSGLVLDEAEAGVNARDSMTKVNKVMNEKVSMGRVGEKYSVYNAPSASQIDKELRMLAHYWVLVLRRGRARVYRLNHNPFKSDTYPEAICELTWGALPADDPVYAKLDEHKWETLEGEGDEYVHAAEVRDRVETARHEERQDARNEFIVRTLEDDLLPRKEVADVVGLTRQRVGQIYREKRDEVEFSAADD